MLELYSDGYSGAFRIPLMTLEYAISRLNGTILQEIVIENYTTNPSKKTENNT
jgi:hypothetical protein